MPKSALIAGVTGIVGNNLADHLSQKGDWTIYGLARKPPVSGPGIYPIAADLMKSAELHESLAGVDLTHVFFCTWSRQKTEEENCEVNGQMLGNLLDAVDAAPNLTHVALVIGTKHYLGPFERYGSGKAETPFREEEPRLPGKNFYYVQEDELFKAAGRRGFSWSVHRPHTIVGYALGNAMNMGVTLAIYATICRETDQPFLFPGSPTQWNGLTDLTDASLLARHLEWASTTTAARNQAFNVVNSDLIRWKWLWPKLASFFNLQAEYSGRATPLEGQMADAGPRWAEIAQRHGLVEYDVNKLASWWHTDADLGRELECFNDMSKSRQLGFLNYRATLPAFLDLFSRLRSERIIP
jgi:nucleoside-diphosphate-sugar epimerase